MSDPIENKGITHFGTMNALLVGLYDGAFSVEEVLKAGSYGLGCSHAVEGEIIIFEGKIYNARPNTPLMVMENHERVPFAEVAEFIPQESFAVQEVDKHELMDQLRPHVKSPNLFLTLRIDGDFSQVKIRMPFKQKKPYPPLLEVTGAQDVETLAACSGTLIGFWGPKSFQGITVPGLHLHFINDDRTQGGHVIDFKLHMGEVALQTQSRINVIVPESGDYITADLDYENMSEHIAQAEG